MTIPVPLPQFIISQVIGVVVLALAVYAFSTKDTGRTLLAFAASSAFSIVMFAFLEDMVGMTLAAGGTVRNLIYYFIQRREGEIPPHWNATVLVVFLAIPAVAVALTWSHWFNWVLLVTELGIVVGGWLRKGHAIRISGVFFSIAFIVHSLMFMNITNIVMHVAMLGSIAVFYFKFFKESKKQKSDAGFHVLHESTYNSEANPQTNLL